jgi:hypothetical protein
MLHNEEGTLIEQLKAIAEKKDTEAILEEVNVSLNTTDDHSDDLNAVIEEGIALGQCAALNNEDIFCFDHDVYWLYFMGTFESVKARLEKLEDKKP